MSNHKPTVRITTPFSRAKEEKAAKEQIWAHVVFDFRDEEHAVCVATDHDGLGDETHGVVEEALHRILHKGEDASEVLTDVVSSVSSAVAKMLAAEALTIILDLEDHDHEHELDTERVTSN
jgi:hypothetical protein